MTFTVVDQDNRIIAISDRMAEAMAAARGHGAFCRVIDADDDVVFVFTPAPQRTAPGGSQSDN